CHALSTTVASMVPFSNAWLSIVLIAGSDHLDVVAARIKTQVFQSEHRRHPDGAADHLHADPFAAQIFGILDVGSDDQIEGDTAGKSADEAEVKTPGRGAESRGAAAVSEMNLAARHTGDHYGRAGHVDLLNVHAKLGKEPFFLRDPKRANSGADIRVADDDFRRGEEECRYEDNDEHESYREVEMFHRKPSSSDLLKLKRR